MRKLTLSWSFHFCDGQQNQIANCSIILYNFTLAMDIQTKLQNAIFLFILPERDKNINISIQVYIS